MAKSTIMMPFEQHQDRERANAGGRPRGQDCGRVDVAFVENAEDQTHHDEGCKDLERGIDVVHIARAASGQQSGVRDG
jgi:hypothetical protein